MLVLAGVLLAPWLVRALAPGFVGEKRALTVLLVRVFFPGAGLLVLSAWCLGILNSHRRFFLSYAAPAVWNLAIIVALLLAGSSGSLSGIALAAAWGAVAGGLLQFLVQLPAVLRLTGRLRLRLAHGSASVRTVVRNFGPAVLSRGVLQISAFVDEVIGSLLPAGALAAMYYAQTLTFLPISLFGLAVSASELPAMSGAQGTAAEVAAYLRGRLDAGLRRIAFFVVPSAMAFVALGHVLVGALYQTGEFTRDDTQYVWGILAGSAVGLLAVTLGRLYSSAYYALRDTRTPLRYAIVRVGATVVLGIAFAFGGPPLLGVDPRWGAAGLTASAGIAGWLEFVLLRRTLGRRIGPTGVSAGTLASLWVSAGLAAGAAWGGLWLVGEVHPLAAAAVALVPYGAVYFSAAALFGVPESRALLQRLRHPRR